MNSQIRQLGSGFLVMLAGATVVFAQSAPTMKPPAKNGHWILEFAVPKKPEGSVVPKKEQPVKVLPLSMDVANGEGIRLFKTKFSDGAEETAYILPGTRLIQRPDLAEIRVLDRLERSLLEYDSPLAAYPGFDWLAPSHFKGEVTFGERACYKFARDLPPLASANDKAGEEVSRSKQGMVTEAYVDKATLLPVAYVDGDMVVSYRFAGVSAPFALPDEFRKAIRRQAGYRD